MLLCGHYLTSFQTFLFVQDLQQTYLHNYGKKIVCFSTVWMEKTIFFVYSSRKYSLYKQAINQTITSSAQWTQWLYAWFVIFFFPSKYAKRQANGERNWGKNGFCFALDFRWNHERLWNTRTHINTHTRQQMKRRNGYYFLIANLNIRYLLAVELQPYIWRIGCVCAVCLARTHALRFDI